MVKARYPFLISVPHGGMEVPEPVRDRLLLTEKDLRHYCDPATREIFGFRDRAAAYIDTGISRMVVDLNRPPLPLPPRDPDGIIKTRTIDGRDVWIPGRIPDLQTIHGLLVAHYFPYHQQIDELLDRNTAGIAFDCHSMLPLGSEHQKDAGKARPLICLGNNGDGDGRPRKGGITTCSREWVTTLADHFRQEIAPGDAVGINNPFSGGFIANAHYWHKGIPWIQIEVSRALYEPASAGERTDACLRPNELRDKIWNALTGFWDSVRT